MNETRIICGCCAGSGSYQPLIGPPEPCGTCKGEKFVADGVEEKLKALGPRPTDPDARRLHKAKEFGIIYGGSHIKTLADQFFNSVEGETYVPENRIHRKGSVTGDINITFTTKNTNQDAIDDLFRSFYRQLEELGAKVEGFKASVGQDKIVLSGDDVHVRTTWYHKQEYRIHVEDLVKSPDLNNDFAAVERHVMEKQALMQLETYKAMTSVPPLFLDPKTGKISNGQSD